MKNSASTPRYLSQVADRYYFDHVFLSANLQDVSGREFQAIFVYNCHLTSIAQIDFQNLDIYLPLLFRK